MREGKQFGLGTTLSMIVGICVGAGIFFKASSILEQTSGQVGLGVLIFLLGALSIIFGSLALAELALRSHRTEGLSAYYEEFVSKRMANGFTSFFAFVYLPSLAAIVSWILGLFILSYLGINIPTHLAFWVQIGIGFLIFCFLLALNYVSSGAGAALQRYTTILKLIPLVIVAVAGLFMGKAENLASSASLPQVSTQGHWVQAILPMIFAYDGWTVVFSIKREVKDPQHTFRKALLIAPAIILILYISYFLGLTSLLGVEATVAGGREAVFNLGSQYLGNIGRLLLSGVVVISVFGSLNGLTLALLRMPHVLAKRGMMGRYTEKFKTDKASGISKASVLVTFLAACFWLMLHILSTQFNLLNGADVGEIAVVFSYFCYIFLFVAVLKLRDLTNPIRRYLVPGLAILSCLFILVASFLASPMNVSLFMLICALPFFYGYLSKTEGKGF